MSGDVILSVGLGVGARLRGVLVLVMGIQRLLLRLLLSPIMVLVGYYYSSTGETKRVSTRCDKRVSMRDNNKLTHSSTKRDRPSLTKSPDRPAACRRHCLTNFVVEDGLTPQYAPRYDTAEGLYAAKIKAVSIP